MGSQCYILTQKGCTWNFQGSSASLEEAFRKVDQSWLIRMTHAWSTKWSMDIKAIQENSLHSYGRHRGDWSTKGTHWIRGIPQWHFHKGLWHTKALHAPYWIQTTSIQILQGGFVQNLDKVGNCFAKGFYLKINVNVPPQWLMEFPPHVGCWSKMKNGPVAKSKKQEECVQNWRTVHTLIIMSDHQLLLIWTPLEVFSNVTLKCLPHTPLPRMQDICFF